MLNRKASRRQLDRPTRKNQIEKLVKSFDIEFDPAAQAAPKWSIYKIPLRLRRANADAYNPHLVSIGPFHHKKGYLLPMEDLKKHYMQSLLARRDGRLQALSDFAAAILDLEAEARNCYAGGIPHENQLAEILLLDGCFILELFIRFHIRQFKKKKLEDRILPFLLHPNSNQSTRLANDPILQSEWLFSTVQRDLALLENQIPFFVLQTLFDTLLVRWRTQLPCDFLAGLAFDFLNPDLHSRRMASKLDHPLHRKHILNLLLNFYLPSSPRKLPEKEQEPGTIFLHNATKLKEAGIQLKKSETGNLFDFKFDSRSRVLEIPSLRIQEWTDSLFRNLMAFEHCCLGHQHQYIASYMLLMDRLLDTKQDVELLIEKKIIINELGGGEYIINFFRDICNQVVVKEFYFTSLCQDVETSYQSLWWRYWQDIKRHHFDTPLKNITWFVGSVIVGATVLQSVYSVLQYYQH